jgi:hypothetical protein
MNYRPVRCLHPLRPLGPGETGQALRPTRRSKARPGGKTRNGPSASASTFIYSGSIPIKLGMCMKERGKGARGAVPSWRAPSPCCVSPACRSMLRQLFPTTTARRSSPSLPSTPSRSTYPSPNTDSPQRAETSSVPASRSVAVYAAADVSWQAAATDEGPELRPVCRHKRGRDHTACHHGNEVTEPEPRPEPARAWTGYDPRQFGRGHHAQKLKRSRSPRS